MVLVDPLDYLTILVLFLHELGVFLLELLKLAVLGRVQVLVLALESELVADQIPLGPHRGLIPEVGNSLLHDQSPLDYLFELWTRFLVEDERGPLLGVVPGLVLILGVRDRLKMEIEIR